MLLQCTRGGTVKSKCYYSVPGGVLLKVNVTTVYQGGVLLKALDQNNVYFVKGDTRESETMFTL